jgi:hypothetical protein
MLYSASCGDRAPAKEAQKKKKGDALRLDSAVFALPRRSSEFTFSTLVKKAVVKYVKSTRGRMEVGKS